MSFGIIIIIAKLIVTIIILDIIKVVYYLSYILLYTLGTVLTEKSLGSFNQ